MPRAGVLLVLLALAGSALPATIRVGPDGDVPTIAMAARLARDGDVVEVQAGEYRGDVAVWLQSRLTIRAVGGRAVLVADGRHAEGKAIWVIRDGEFVVEGFDFVGARVPDRNGAGIRFERGRLTVRDSRFIDNENGILTANDDAASLTVDRCLFSGNGHGDGQSHGLYVGTIGELTVQGSYFRRGRRGHLLKSRARRSYVGYSRITDEGGSASYELEFPNGGEVTVIGSLIEQGAGTENPAIVAYGADGYSWPRNTLALVHDTVVNRRAAGGIPVRAWPGSASVQLVNNLFVGPGRLAVAVPLHETGSARASFDAFHDADGHDYRPRAGAPFVGSAVDVAAEDGRAHPLTHRYVHERMLVPQAGSRALTPGAFQP